MNDGYRGVHDLGGLPSEEEIDRTEHEPSLFEKRVDALIMLMSHPDKRAITVDELRRGIEPFSVPEYFDLAYYEKWVLVLKMLMVEKGIMSEEEISQRIAEIRNRPASSSAG